MKRTSTNKTGIVHTHALKFSKVADGRKQPISGRWIRDDRFCAQVSNENSAKGEKCVGASPLWKMTFDDFESFGSRTINLKKKVASMVEVETLFRYTRLVEI